VIQRNRHRRERTTLLGEMRACIGLAKEYITTYRELSQLLEIGTDVPEDISEGIKHAKQAWLEQTAKYEELRVKLHSEQKELSVAHGAVRTPS
jgi:hypothetical protein